jgi:hypothetical protein
VTSARPWYAGGHRIERRWDAWRRGLKARMGWLDPAVIQPFRGYGDGRRLRLKGRVLEQGGLERWHGRAGVGSNLMRMFHRFESDEIPDARIRASFGGRAVEAISDEEGYFDVALDGLAAAQAGERWQMVDLELLAPLVRDQHPVRLAAPVLTPPYRGVAAHAVPDTVILACQDHRAAAAPGWFSCWLPSMVQVADPPAPPTRLDR